MDLHAEQIECATPDGPPVSGMRLGPVEVSTLNGPDETIEFRLPPELASVSSQPRLPIALARPLSQG